MKNTKVSLIPLTADDREQFILDNQWAFKYGAIMEFGERDDHIDEDGEIISRTTIEKSIYNPKSETYRIMRDNEKVMAPAEPTVSPIQKTAWRKVRRAV